MPLQPGIRLTRGLRKGEPVVRIEFPYSRELAGALKIRTTARWSQSLGCWYIFEKDFQLKDFFNAMRDMAYINYGELNGQHSGPVEKQPAKEKEKAILPAGYLEQLQQELYSENTIKTYTHYFKDFVVHFSGWNLPDVGLGEINAYILELIKERNISSSQQNQRINAIKFYYEKVLDRNKEYYNIGRPRRGRHLPDVLSREEIGKMIKVADNLKHKCLIAVIYSCGLRRREALTIKIEDIDSNRMVIKINGKGEKDRYIGFSSNLLEMLRAYYREFRPKDYLFQGQNGGIYSEESVWKVVKQVARKAGIKRRVYPHILRHSGVYPV